MPHELSHADCINIVAEARSAEGAFLVLPEFRRSMGTRGEVADVLSFYTNGMSAADEIKISAADFLADADKPHMQRPELACGAFRKYVCPEGVIEGHEVEERGHGLDWITTSGELVEVVPAPPRHRWAKHVERDILVKWAMRQTMGDAPEIAGRIGGRPSKPRKAPVMDAVARELGTLEQASPKQIIRTLGLWTMTPAKLSEAMSRDERFERDGPGGSWRLAEVGEPLKLSV